MPEPRGPDLEFGALRTSELREAADLLALAFRDNPLNRAATAAASPERRLASNRHGMRALLPTALARGFVRAARGRRGLWAVLVSTPPLAYPLPPPPLWTRFRCALGQGLAVAQRWERAFEQLHAVHPAEPHWYLGALGVLPDRQRQGVGSALLAHWLEAMDPADGFQYLETDRERNLGFYARAGFECLGELSVLGTRVWRMRRN